MIFILQQDNRDLSFELDHPFIRSGKHLLADGLCLLQGVNLLLGVVELLLILG